MADQQPQPVASPAEPAPVHDESCFRPSSILVDGEWRPVAIPALDRALRGRHGRRRFAGVDRPCEKCDVDYERAARELRARRRRHHRRTRAAACPPELLGGRS